LFTLEGDKATEDVEATDAGTLHITPGGPKAGDTVAVGLLLGHLLVAGESAPVIEAPVAIVEGTVPAAAPEAIRPVIRDAEAPAAWRRSSALTGRACKARAAPAASASATCGPR